MFDVDTHDLTKPVREPAGEEPTDGRRLRRERNRGAVVESLLGHYREGNLAPSAEDIAERAGLSPRSLHRYFDDLDDLARTAIDRAQADVAHLFEVRAAPDDPFAERVRALVDQRSILFEAVESVALVTRLRAPFHRVVADNLTRNRARLRRQIERLFAAELSDLDSVLADRRLALADVATSFEAYRLLRDDQGLDVDEARSVLTESITLLLTGGNP